MPSGVRVVESTSRGVDPASRHVDRSHHGVPAQREWGVGREGHAVSRLQPTVLRLQGDLHLRHFLRHHAGLESKLKSCRNVQVFCIQDMFERKVCVVTHELN